MAMTMKRSPLLLATLLALSAGPTALAQAPAAPPPDGAAAAEGAPPVAATEEAPPTPPAPSAAEPASDEAPAANAPVAEAPPASVEPAAIAAPSVVASTAQVASHESIPESYWRGSVYEDVRGSVVGVLAEGGRGAGFVFHSPQHVATSLDVVDSGRAVRVQVPGEEDLRDAQVVALDRDAGLAILEVEAPIAEPLSLGSAARVGESVISVGAPGRTWGNDPEMEGLSEAPMMQSAIGAIGPRRFRLDGSPCAAGAPIFNEAGEVVGLVAGGRGETIVRAERLTGILDQIGSTEPYTGRWRLRPEIALGASWDGDQLWGGSLGVRAMAPYGLGFALRGGYWWSNDDVSDEAVFERSRKRGVLEAEMLYRLRIPIGSHSMSIFAAAGAFGAHQWRTDRSLALETPACDPNVEQCTAETFIVEDDINSWIIRPQLRAGIGKGCMELGYTLQLDPENGWNPVHGLNIMFSH